MENLSINICPHCGKSIKPILTLQPNQTYEFFNQINSYLQVYRCPSCLRHFISVDNFSDEKNTLITTMIYPAPKQVFNKIISDISPNFINIYNQSLSAESNGLDEIAGMGYRKAAEFLIKDYLIEKFPEYRDNFIKAPISQCIENKTIEGKTNYMPCVNSSYLNEISKRIIWLGNDETHYFRKHTDKDISDLKALINIAIQHIILEYSTKKYIQEIQPK